MIAFEIFSLNRVNGSPIGSPSREILTNVGGISLALMFRSLGKKKAKPVNKDRFISKMFLRLEFLLQTLKPTSVNKSISTRGDSVILVLKNPLAAAGTA